jgi:D-amino peptidase
MRFMIRCDLEGVSGVVASAQVTPGAAEYAYGVAMLHHDLLAVIDSLLATGDHEIWVYDMHCAGRNVDLASLPPQVRVVCGKPHYRPGDLGGLTRGFHGQLLVGLHSMAGTGELLAHSYEHAVQALRLNGRPVGEIGLEAALAGELGVPTLLVTGDSAGCAEARALLGDIPTVAVKDSRGASAGVCYPTTRTGAQLRDAARAAALRTVHPFTVPPPVTLEITLDDSPFADHVRGQLAEAVRNDGVIALTADTLAAAWLRYLQVKP